MELYELIEKYGKGKGEAVMWDATKAVSEFIKPMKDTHKKEYWHLMRNVFGMMSNGHYDEEFAIHDVANLEYTDKENKQHKGAYWTCEQTEEMTKGLTLPASTTKWDVFVALNVFWSDTCKVLTAEQIVAAAFQFFFADEDWNKENGSKIWCYMNMIYQ